MSCARTFTAMSAVDHLLLMVGGDQSPDNETGSTMEMFDRRTGLWSMGPSTRLKRDSCRLVQLGDFVYAIGGHNNNTNQYLNSCERFSIKSGAWEEAPKMRVARRSPGVVAYKGQLYVVGGMGSKRDLTSMERLCPVTRRWVMMPQTLTQLSGWASAVMVEKPLRLL